MTTPTPPTPPPQLAFDWQEFLPHLAESALTDDEKQDFIETIWSIVITFVDLGFEVCGTQETCGQAFDLKAALGRAVVSSDAANEKGDAA